MAILKRTLLLSLLVLSLVGLLGIFSTKLPPLSKKLDGPEFCGSCHVMAPWVDTYLKSSHKGEATCGGCHIPHNFISGAFYKAFTGTRDGLYMIIGKIPESFQISWHGAKVVNDNCYSCHAEVMKRVGYPLAERDKNCFDCHRNMPHDRMDIKEGGKPQ